VTVHKCDKEHEISEIKTTMAVMSQKVVAIEKKLFGNGVNGLISKMDDVLKHIYRNEGKEEIKQGIEAWSRRKFIVYLSTVGLLVLFFFQLSIEYFKNRLFGG
jgi:hypothetical protein